MEVLPMKLKPLSDRLIVRAIEEELTTASGLVLPDTAKEKPQKGEVVAAGDGKLDDDGKRIPLDVKKGDEVLYSKYGGARIKIHGGGPPLVGGARRPSPPRGQRRFEKTWSPRRS